MKILTLFLCGISHLSLSSANEVPFLTDDFIKEINSKQNQWKAGRNFRPDTPVSQMKMMLGAILDNREKKQEDVKTSDPLWPEKKNIPEEFDSRKKWAICPKIGEILDQGMCGSCWAISTSQAFTDRYCIATTGKHQMRLSTANVVSCCGEYCSGSGGEGCGGGYLDKAWSYFHTHGLPSGGNYNTTEGCQPYNIQSPCNYHDGSPYQKCHIVADTPQCETKCTNGQYTVEISKDLRFSKKEYYLPDEEAIMRDIMTHGPVVAGFYAYDDLYSYKSGVYEPLEGSRKNGGHALTLIGWGVEKQVPYWLAKNSWNDYWGDHGFVKIKRNNPKMQLENFVWAAVPDTKKHGD